jgi:hypothetical protein
MDKEIVMEMIDVKEWDAAFGGFNGWMAQIEEDRINFELQLLAEEAFDMTADLQYNAMTEEFSAEFSSNLPIDSL